MIMNTDALTGCLPHVYSSFMSINRRLMIRRKIQYGHYTSLTLQYEVFDVF